MIICEASVCPEFAPELPSDKPAQAPSLTSGERRQTVGLFPVHLVAFAIASDDAKGNVVKAKVNVVEPLGMETLVHFRLAQTAMVARLPPDPRIAVNAVLSLDVDVDRIHLFDPQSNVLIC